MGKLCSKARSSASAGDDCDDGDDGGDADSKAETGKGKKGASFSEDAYLHAIYTGVAGDFPPQVRALLRHDKALLPPPHPGDVTTPPPDCC